MKKHSKAKLKGTVLFTVISVMSLLIIFLTSTLVLATSASNRSHKNYASTQTEYTARAAIDSFSEAMSRNDAIAQMIVNMKKTDILTPSVEINDSALGQIGYYDNSGTWVPGQISIEYIDDTYVYNTEKLCWEEQQVLKVTATAELAGEESTVSAYIRKKSPDEPTQLSIKGLQTAGTNTPDNTQGTYTGALAMGLRDKDDSGDPIPKGKYVLNNGTILNTDLAFINGDLSVSGEGLKINVTEPSTGTVIKGNLWFQNSNFINVDYSMPSDFTQKEVPYLYVDGAWYVSNSLHRTANTGAMGNNAPFNIFVGTLYQNSNTMSFDSDLYLMDTVDETTYDVLYNGSNHQYIQKGKNKIGADSSYLNEWITSVVQKSDTQFDSVGGNIYSKGDLELCNVTVNGDVRCEGDVTINANGNGDVVINGDLVLGAGKTLTFNGSNKSLKVSGNVYCDSINLNGLPNDHFTIKGVQYGDSILGDDYIEVDNIYHPEEAVVKSGYYSSVNARRFEKFEATERVPEWNWRYKGLYGENIDYNQIVYYDYDYKTNTVSTSWYTDSDVKVKSGLYIETDPYGRETGYIVSEENSYFKSTDTTKVSKEEACDITPEHMTIVAFDGTTDTGVETTEPKSYYNKNTGDRVDSSIAYTAAVLPSGSFNTLNNGGGIYPKTMTREAVTGEDASGISYPDSKQEYKIIASLKEMQESIGYSSSGFDSNVYFTDVPGGTDSFKSEDLSGNNSLTINENTIISGTGNNANITINPGNSTIWVVLDNVTFNNGANIYVDDSQGGTVNLLIRGTLTAKGLKMTTSKIYNGAIVNSNIINNEDKLKINWYGADGSSIYAKDTPCTFIGNAKMPYTSFEDLLQGNYSVTYDGTSMTPVWVGSGLFKSVKTYNNFQLAYVPSGGSSDSTITNQLLGESWEIMYYDMY